MSGRGVSCVLCSWLLVATALSVSSAQEDESHEDTQVAADLKEARGSSSGDVADPLEVTVAGDLLNRVGQPMFTTLAIRNASGTKLQIKNLNVKIDGASAEQFVSLDCPLKRRGELSLAPGQRFEQPCRFEMKPITLERSPFTWHRALLSAQVRFDVDADIDHLGNYHYYPSITVQAHEFSIFVGGMFGAILLATFGLTQSLLSDPTARGAWGKEIGYAVLLAIRGGIMAIIALLLSKTTQGGGSPISLTVTDFAGGIMIGLFSFPLASWISSTLKVESRSVAIAGQDNPPANEPLG